MDLVKITDVSGTPDVSVRWHNDINPLGGYRKRRLIEAPNDPMRAVQKRLLEALRSLEIDLWQATGGVKGENAVTNLLRHRRNRFFYHVDLHAAYSSVDIARLANLLAEEVPGITPDEMLAFLEQYSESEVLGGLATGLNACPDLFNIYIALTIGRALRSFLERHEITFSFFLDDLLFSSNITIGKVKRKQIRECVESFGFSFSHRKCAVYDRDRGPIIVNGVGLAPNGRLFVPTMYLKRFRRTARAYLAGDPTVSFEVVGGLYGFFRYLRKINARRGFWPNETEAKNIALFGEAQEEYRRRKRAER